MHYNIEDNWKLIEVNTVDQFQGRDKDIIIYSCTKSCSSQSSSKEVDGEILNDKRRLTVALTRSKCKLIMIGDKETLRNYKPFQELLSSLDEENIVDLSNEDSHFDWNSIFDRTDYCFKSHDVTML